MSYQQPLNTLYLRYIICGFEYQTNCGCFNPFEAQADRKYDGLSMSEEVYKHTRAYEKNPNKRSRETRVGIKKATPMYIRLRRMSGRCFDQKDSGRTKGAPPQAPPGREVSPLFLVRTFGCGWMTYRRGIARRDSVGQIPSSCRLKWSTQHYSMSLMKPWRTQKKGGERAASVPA